MIRSLADRLCNIFVFVPLDSVGHVKQKKKNFKMKKWCDFFLCLSLSNSCTLSSMMCTRCYCLVSKIRNFGLQQWENKVESLSGKQRQRGKRNMHVCARERAKLESKHHQNQRLYARILCFSCFFFCLPFCGSVILCVSVLCVRAHRFTFFRKFHATFCRQKKIE